MILPLLESVMLGGVKPTKHLSKSTVLNLIKLTKLAVALRLRCGSCKLIF